MYHSHAFVPWTFCLQTPVYCTSPSRFLWRTVCLCCRHYKCTSLLVGSNNQHFSIVSNRCWRGEDGYYNSLISQPLHYRIISPPSASSLAVPLSSSMLLLSKRSGGGHDEEGEQLPSFILTCEPCAMTSQERRPVCQGNSSATEEIAIYFIPNGWNCSRVKSNAESYFTVLPSLCSRFFRLRIYCTGSGHSSAGSTSHGNPVLDQILFKYFCLIYSCIRLFCGLWRRRAARQLPLWPTGLMFLVNMGTLSGGSGEEEAVCPVYQWEAAAQGTEQVVLVVCWRAHGHKVVFTRLSFFHVWTLGEDQWHFSVAWAKDLLLLLLLHLSLTTHPSISLSLTARL